MAAAEEKDGGEGQKDAWMERYREGRMEADGWMDGWRGKDVSKKGRRDGWVSGWVVGCMMEGRKMLYP